MKACGETVRPKFACILRRDSVKREAPKTNKTVSERPEFWEAPNERETDWGSSHDDLAINA